MDGLFELMFIGFFVLASIFDAVARSRRKKRRMEDMEAEEPAEEGGQDRAEEYSLRDWEPEAREQESWERSGAEESTTTATRDRATDRSTSSGRGTSDDMVPDDLWAILTGEERRGSTPAKQEQPEPPAEPHIPMPVPSDRYGRPAGAGGIGDRGAAIGVAEIGSGDRPEVRPAARAAGSLARRPVGDLDDSIATIHGRSRRGASPYVAKLRHEGRTGLREAVVLSEALGEPVSLRARGGGWQGEPR